MFRNYGAIDTYRLPPACSGLTYSSCCTVTGLGRVSRLSCPTERVWFSREANLFTTALLSGTDLTARSKSLRLIGEPTSEWETVVSWKTSRSEVKAPHRERLALILIHFFTYSFPMFQGSALQRWRLFLFARCEPIGIHELYNDAGLAFIVQLLEHDHYWNTFTSSLLGEGIPDVRNQWSIRLYKIPVVDDSCNLVSLRWYSVQTTDKAWIDSKTLNAVSLVISLKRASCEEKAFSIPTCSDRPAYRDRAITAPSPNRWINSSLERASFKSYRLVSKRCAYHLLNLLNALCSTVSKIWMCQNPGQRPWHVLSGRSTQPVKTLGHSYKCWRTKKTLNRKCSEQKAL